MIEPPKSGLFERRIEPCNHFADAVDGPYDCRDDAAHYPDVRDSGHELHDGRQRWKIAERNGGPGAALKGLKRIKKWPPRRGIGCASWMKFVLAPTSRLLW